MTPAETCRANGWQVGDVLEGDEGHGPERIKITAIGEESILARAVLSDEPRFAREAMCSLAREGVWNLSFRDWRKVG